MNPPVAQYTPAAWNGTIGINHQQKGGGAPANFTHSHRSFFTEHAPFGSSTVRWVNKVTLCKNATLLQKTSEGLAFITKMLSLSTSRRRKYLKKNRIPFYQKVRDSKTTSRQCLGLDGTKSSTSGKSSPRMSDTIQPSTQLLLLLFLASFIEY